MIPLAQYLSDMQDDEFVFARSAERRASLAQAHASRTEPLAIRTLKPMPPRPGLPVADVLRSTVPTGGAAAELEAAREGFAAEREQLAQAAAAARDEAVAAAEAALRAEHEAAIEAALAAQRETLEAGHAEALLQARETWTSEQADRLADLTILQMAVFEDTMRATVSAVLRPLASGARERQAISELADAVRVIAPEGEPYRIAATGPSDLLAKFRAKLGDRAERITVKPDETRVDIRIDADATQIETRLQAWGRALEKALS